MLPWLPPRGRGEKTVDKDLRGAWGEPSASVGGELDEIDDLLNAVSVETEPEPDDSAEPRVFGYVQDHEKLRRGDHFKTTPGSPEVYRVVSVNESRAHCRLVSGGKSRTIDVSPRSTVYRVDPASAHQPTQSQKESTTMSVSAIPVATKTTRQQEKERRSAKAATSAAKATAKGRAVKVSKPTKTVRQCLCGTCSEETMGFFAPGHDARFKGLMVKVERGDLAVTDLPKAVQKAYTFKKRGDGFVTTENYKGEKHDGYDTAKPKAKKA